MRIYMKITNEMIHDRMQHLRKLLHRPIYKKENLLIVDDDVILNFKNKMELNNFLYNIIKLHKNNIIISRGVKDAK